MSKYISNLILTKFILCAIVVFSSNTYAQSPDILSEEFLAGLPPSVRDEIEVKNKVNEGIELENLFRSETSLDKNKIILKKLKEQVTALEKRFSGEGNPTANFLPVFGQSFLAHCSHHLCP